MFKIIWKRVLGLAATAVVVLAIFGGFSSPPQAVAVQTATRNAVDAGLIALNHEVNRANIEPFTVTAGWVADLRTAGNRLQVNLNNLLGEIPDTSVTNLTKKILLAKASELLGNGAAGTATNGGTGIIDYLAYANINHRHWLINAFSVLDQITAHKDDLLELDRVSTEVELLRDAVNGNSHGLLDKIEDERDQALNNLADVQTKAQVDLTAAQSARQTVESERDNLKVERDAASRERDTFKAELAKEVANKQATGATPQAGSPTVVAPGSVPNKPAININVPSLQTIVPEKQSNVSLNSSSAAILRMEVRSGKSATKLELARDVSITPGPNKISLADKPSTRNRRSKGTPLSRLKSGFYTVRLIHGDQMVREFKIKVRSNTKKPKKPVSKKNLRTKPKKVSN